MMETPTSPQDNLREKLQQKVGQRPLKEVAKELGLHSSTLYRFLRGKKLSNSNRKLIELWVSREPESTGPLIAALSAAFLVELLIIIILVLR